MRILGIDYGQAKLGLSIADGPLAEPFKVIEVTSQVDAVEKIKGVIEFEAVEKVVVGVSEGEMGRESSAFSRQLSEEISIPVETFDETLTTKEALAYAVEAGIKRSKRQKMEHAYAATITLQNYLDFRA